MVPELATEKAIELVKMSVARARLLAPLKGTSFAIDQSGIVIGGGLSGMTAALALANQGFKVNLIERSERLGGNLLELNYTLEHEDISSYISDIIKSVESHPNIKLHLSTEVTGLEGYIGCFKVAVSNNGNHTKIPGGIILWLPAPARPGRKNSCMENRIEF